MTKRAFLITISVLILAAIAAGVTTTVLNGNYEVKGNFTVDGTCTGCSAGGSVNSGAAGNLGYYATTGSTISDSAITAGSIPIYCADASGSATTYTCTGPTSITAYVTGMTVTFIPETQNTGPSTLNISSIGAIAIRANNTSLSALVAADLLAGGYYTLIYDGTYFEKANGPDGAWTALSGLYQTSTVADFSGFGQAGAYRKTRDGTVQVRGLLTCNGNRTISSSTLLWTFPAGFRPGAAVIFTTTFSDTNTLIDIEVDSTGGTSNRNAWTSCVANSSFMSNNYSFTVY